MVDAGLGIELADQRGVVAGEPDVAVLVLDQTMRSGVRRLERIFPDRAGLRIDPAELVDQLPGPPDGAVLGRERIVRARAERRHVPHLDRGLHRAGDDRGGRPRPLREGLHQIGRDRRPFLRRDRRAEVLHHVLEHVPAGRRVAGARAVDVVAAAADRDDGFLARAVREGRRCLLAPGRMRASQQDGRENGQY